MANQRTTEKKTKRIITLEQIKSRTEIRELILASNEYLRLKGYTEHGIRHVGYVSKTSANLLEELGYSARDVELAAIAGWLHDIGNSVNRLNHGIIGATLAYPILMNMGMDYKEIIRIVAAIGNHEENIGIPVSEISAALIIADKSDAHRTRVRRGHYDETDIHDRVNYSIKKNYLIVDKARKVIRLVIYMNELSSPMEYLEIYMSRMILSERAASYLDCKFELCINDVVVNNHYSKSSKFFLDEGEAEVSEDHE